MKIRDAKSEVSIGPRSPDRDVSGRGLGPADLGHHGGALGSTVSPSTVSNLNKKINAKIEPWRNRRIEGEHPYLYLDGIVMKRSWAGEVRNVSLLAASAVNSEGFCEILGICEGAKEDNPAGLLSYAIWSTGVSKALS